eukprot:TRINITY_DN13678_c0_g1_i3.p1 TRINITY_DN13678_c0_g1~~TRINITY_DN13678_c0_g1_i3.p1  ORF type:complete len:112 (-),score=23.47 TRINITY_DN13678_c0_g1_i3:84-419(-)
MSMDLKMMFSRFGMSSQRVSTSSRRYEVILSDSNYFFQQIDKVDRTCSALEAKIEATVRSNKDQPKCKEAIERVQKAIREGIAKKKGLSRLKNEKQLRIAVLNNCSRVNTK